MKKILTVLALLACGFLLFAQNNISVDVYNDIYMVIDNAQMRGLCAPVPGAKPYTQKKILSILDEILENDEKLTAVELQTIMNYKDSVKFDVDDKRIGTLNFYNEDWTSVPMTFQFNYGLKSYFSTGIYNNSDFTSFGFDFMPTFGFTGDIGESFGYTIQGVVDVSKMPLHKDGTYNVGTNLYPYITIDDAGNPKVVQRGEDVRNINVYSNFNSMPFSYIKPWGGQFYYLSNMTAAGLEGWAHELGVSGNIFAELHASLLNDKINLGFGRIYREWAAMDNHSSLVLNGSAMPFMGIDMTFEVLPFLSYSSVTGTLEYPNRDDILYGSLPGDDQDDASLWQNAFSINMVELNYKGLHVDFGSSCIWPKRLELGYLFPLTNYVEYQNHLGDYDNLALFGDLKYTKENLGSVWASLYLDEINGLNNNPLTSTRAMFATQIGIKAVIPNISFGSIAFRYTKVEPYCYTHHSVNYLPYYDGYVCMNYSNNGISLGSYLPPNSDEFLIRFDMRPINNLNTSFAYQLIRHGADFGNQSVRGSSIYSELNNQNRDELKKYFLHDGAYNWIHAISANGSYVSKQTKVPFKVDLTLGFVISYFTAIDQVNYDNKDEFGNSNANFDTPYSIIDTNDYPFNFGPVLTIGFTVGKF